MKYHGTSLGRIFATSFEAGCNSNSELYSQGLSRVFANIRNLVLQGFAGILAAGSGAGCNSNFGLNSYGLFHVFEKVFAEVSAVFAESRRTARWPSAHLPPILQGPPSSPPSSARPHRPGRTNISTSLAYRGHATL